ncbi:hypothetical protein GCM10018793_40990 [Streptomyces sulfonofaciens]|uniref:Aldehyde dehydrogenase domain-containing protein n=1 Tax=Streptomyces sulfonofaciens TaxID=68272 RepID=A0A919GCQ1_9ACTN|nr:aldehyde dehydrogenase family protein [Streptomyces sulfonofaciens]GHH82071.1 hypothetical protein GCM10018793_40990 [Streptomyces sulfonofaciens]
MSTVRSTNPHAPGETVAEVPATPADRLPALLELAAHAGRDWAHTPAPERASALTRVADDIAAASDRLADLVSREVGKPITEARGEVTRAERARSGRSSTRLHGTAPWPRSHPARDAS